MALSSFCGLLTLQVGVALLAAVFFTLAGVILAANVFSYETMYDGWPLSLIFMILFVIGLIIAGSLMFFSSYAENRSLAMAAMMVIIILFFYWVVLCCFSFVSAPGHVRTVCIYLHCPESFWIASLAYRTYYYIEDDEKQRNDTEKYYKQKRSIDNIYQYLDVSLTQDQINHSIDQSSYQNYDYYLKNSQKTYKKRSEIADGKLKNGKHNMKINSEDLFHRILNQEFIQAIPSTTIKNLPTQNPELEERSRYYVGLALLGAVLLFIINFIFLLFSICVMWSWASELNWADYYIEDEPVVVYADEY